MAVSQTQDVGDRSTPGSTRVTKSAARSRFLARHFVAWICSMLVLVCVVVVTYDVYGVSEAELAEMSGEVWVLAAMTGVAMTFAVLRFSRRLD